MVIPVILKIYPGNCSIREIQMDFWMFLNSVFRMSLGEVVKWPQADNMPRAPRNVNPALQLPGWKIQVEFRLSTFCRRRAFAQNSQYIFQVACIPAYQPDQGKLVVTVYHTRIVTTLIHTTLEKVKSVSQAYGADVFRVCPNCYGEL